VPSGNITYKRRHISLDDLPAWESSNVIFSVNLVVKDEGTISDSSHEALQVDFANGITFYLDSKILLDYVGGGALNYGHVQEEIRFAECMSLVLSNTVYRSRVDCLSSVLRSYEITRSCSHNWS
jgi:hypothetical protein